MLAVAMTHLTPSDILVHLSCRKSQKILVFSAFLILALFLFQLMSLSACLSQGFRCHAALQRPLDDDEAPLRLTESQTATTRGVVVSGIMGALDIAPTSHIVERGLKISSAEWIKVMVKNIPPNCADLMESGQEF